MRDAMVPFTDDGLRFIPARFSATPGFPFRREVLAHYRSQRSHIFIMMLTLPTSAAFVRKMYIRTRAFRRVTRFSPSALPVYCGYPATSIECRSRPVVPCQHRSQPLFQALHIWSRWLALNLRAFIGYLCGLTSHIAGDSVPVPPSPLLFQHRLYGQRLLRPSTMRNRLKSKYSQPLTLYVFKNHGDYSSLAYLHD